MNSKRSEFPSVVTPSGTVVVFGGLTGSVVAEPCTNTIEEYNPATDTWTIIGTMVTERRRHAARLIDDHRTLIVGGACKDRITVPTAEDFGLESNTTTQVQDLPQPRYEQKKAECITRISTVSFITIW